MNPRAYTWRVAALHDESPSVRTLFLEPTAERPSFIPGQYVTVMLPGRAPREGKSYSISSVPDDPCLTLTVKRMGTFSEVLLAHTVGDTLTTSAPYGFFYPNPACNERPLAFIAGGIGIAPIMSMVRAFVAGGDARALTLFYSNRTVAETIFKETLDALAIEHHDLSLYYTLTRERSPSSAFHEGRLSKETIMRTLPTPATTDFFLCGSIEFTKAMWKLLHEGGIESSQIYTEGFF